MPSVMPFCVYLWTTTFIVLAASRAITEDSSSSGDVLDDEEEEAACQYKGIAVAPDHMACLKPNSKYTKDVAINAEDILMEHNKCRENVDPPAETPLPALEWDNDLAFTAAQWTRQCNRRHDTHDRRSQPDKFDYVGQNLASVPGTRYTLSSIVRRWCGEMRSFKYGVGPKKKGRKIGHFTQLVWQETTKVGCAQSVCRSRTYYVCNYGEAGNQGYTFEEAFARPYVAAGNYTEMY